MGHLYTIICEYDGGTYVAQVNANSPRAALLSWLEGKDIRDQIPTDVQKDVREELVSSSGPVAINGCQNTWCHTSSSNKGLVLINIVRTHSGGA